MLFDGMEFHNVEEMKETEKGYALLRLPKSVREQMNDGVKNSLASTGVEIRFKMKSDTINLYLCADLAEEAQPAYIFYGSFQGGWQNSSRMIGTEKTKLTIKRPDNLRDLKRMTRELELGFDPEVVRVILPYVNCYYVGREGEVEVPEKEEMPDRVYLAYGSSITHGSLALAPVYTYPFRIAQKMNCDYINLGFAGSAYMEKVMAEYIVSRKDWDFASVEMGINMCNDNFTKEEFEERIQEFVPVLNRDSRPIFATDIFGCNRLERQEKVTQYREIVKKHTGGTKLVYTCGLDLLDNPAYLSQDDTHPSLEGIQEITENWLKVMKKYV